MSQQTRAIVEDAIRAHVADETNDRIVIGWELVCVTTTPADAGTGGAYYWRDCAAGQPHHASVGLIEVGRELLADNWRSAD